MAKDRMQASRFEQKYIISEDLALQIRDFARSHFELDENAAGRPNYSYSVHSLYLDSDDLRLYWATINRDKNRFKMRLRFYDENPNAPVFLEIKERVNTSRVKKRVPVHRDTFDALLAGDTPRPSHLPSKEPQHLSILAEYYERMREIGARPKIHIGYLREAYMPHNDNSVRLTLDREVRAQPERAARLSTTMANATLVWGKDVVLELKYTGRFPASFRDMVSTFNLRVCGAAKYADAVALLGEYKITGPPGAGN